ncbi:hypothetical protein DFH07DRAFT_745553 [Mycena maculata]|uniref:Uncharacterized protein n=1 Tax=Mycena maculata TaxID=230809 RepID=A0AAD7IXC2_9AGAR|nr:hypothetical protein DFH07DRAFT_745553 [Mycena maculata]
MADDEAGPHTLHAPTARTPIHFPNPDETSPIHAPPLRHSSPLAMSSNGRRRVHSVNPASSTMPTHPRSRRPLSMSFGNSHPDSTSSAMEDSGISLLSDEYDLYPRILQDVQRALKLKARREARLKSANSSPSSNKSDAASASSQPKTSPLRPIFPPAPFPPPPIPAIREIEEPSPSPHGSKPTVANHPIPTSSDEGTTLDWSGLGSEDDKLERRWTLSVSKRKDRDKHPSNSAVETRESMYAAKVLQIRSKVSPRALERASVACDQLSRRYKFVYDSLSSPKEFNISKVARWFGNQEAVVQSSLEQAEPLTWLKDLESTRKNKDRIPWNLSALIMEEYMVQLRSKGNAKPQMHNRVASLNSSPNLSIASPPQYPSPQGSSYLSLGPSLTRKLSYEGRISFEPLALSGRRSIDRESRKSGESGYSSIRSASSLHHAISPTSSHFHLIPSRIGSENGGSSRNSLSEQSDDGGVKKRPIVPPAPLNRDLLSGSTVKPNVIPDLKSPPTSTPDKLGVQPEKREGASSSMDKSSLDIPPTATGRDFSQRKVRMSMPSGDNLRLQMEERRQRDADEEQTSREYELKQQLLDATIHQNNRVRQLLNHIAAGVREYDQAQASLSTSLKLPHRGIPRELVDAFSHDPAAVTGATRTYKSWRAVDDIQHRLARQRETFREFLSRPANVDYTIEPESVLEDPIAALMESLKSLDAERQEIAWRATEVSDVLKRVQTVHTEVKAAYNGTMSHTSVIYPEISQIVALEESYKDQYQYFWELAMDVLTFVLDTVTPFWRTYGKTIGDDVQHFLIIPLYRNEFTGESKRYTIDKFPRRSLRHWVFLFLFFLGTVALTFLQTRAAVSSTAHFWLAWIPYIYLRRLMLIPYWVGIIIQWWAVGAELCIVLTQMAVVVWWAGWYVNIFS